MVYAGPKRKSSSDWMTGLTWRCFVMLMIVSIRSPSCKLHHQLIKQNIMTVTGSKSLNFVLSNISLWNLIVLSVQLYLLFAVCQPKSVDFLFADWLRLFVCENKHNKSVLCSTPFRLVYALFCFVRIRILGGDDSLSSILRATWVSFGCFGIVERRALSCSEQKMPPEKDIIIKAWEKLDDDVIIKEVATKGKHVNLCIGYLAERNELSHSEAKNYFLQKVKRDYWDWILKIEEEPLLVPEPEFPTRSVYLCLVFQSLLWSATVARPPIVSLVFLGLQLNRGLW